MSAQPVNPAVPPDHVSIEIDGKLVHAPKGSMIIQAADRIGVSIPRFCYHEKLPIAANCRMCMVEVEMGGRPMPKPQPACATPVAEGMKISTQSNRALSAQRNAMEFLLINHPLDCPVCDQGGECELQDLSMGYGRSVSRFAERKRSVPDEDLGPLVATEMTRCIHCTRCIRVMAEVAGTYELGGMERGERLQIGTHVGKPLMSELSGNVIDVCPVGALTNKPFQFKARAWELIARESIGYHDALGSNLWLHTRRGEVLRTVPRDNEAINECWLSDRDRYSHEGLYAEDRARVPMIRRNGELVEVSWNDALAFVAERLGQARGGIGAVVAPLASNEEGSLLARLVRALGCDGIDHRLRVSDFSDQPHARTFEMPIAEIEKADAVLVVGCDPRGELPLLNHRLRKAAKRGATVYALNSIDVDFTFALSGRQVVTPGAMLDRLLGLAKAASTLDGAQVPPALAEAVRGAASDAIQEAWVQRLGAAGSAVIILGESVVQHVDAAWLRAVAGMIARATGAALNEIPNGANAVGLSQAGVLPQGKERTLQAMLEQPPKALIAWHAGSADFASPAAFKRAREAAEAFIYIGAYACSGVRKHADAVLPIGLPPEIDGSYTNLDGHVQSMQAGAKLPGEARPGWKVLRALGAAMAVPGFDFTELSGIGADAPVEPAQATTLAPRRAVSNCGAFERIATTAIYRADAVLRRAPALNAHPLTRGAMAVLSPEDAKRLGVGAKDQVKVNDITLAVGIDRAVPAGAVWIEAGYGEVGSLPAHGMTVSVARAGA